MTTDGEKVYEVVCACFILISLATGVFLFFK
jgi:hypothetical protein